MSIEIKDAEVLGNMMHVPAHINLTKLMLWLCGRVHVVVITSAYRDGDDGVHGQVPYRGMDLRSWTYDVPSNIVRRVNENWVYDPDRPEFQCAILHDTGAGEHIHLQVHPRTYIKEL